MHRLHRALVTLAALVATLAAAAPALAGQCGKEGYSYAGFQSARRAHGVSARIGLLSVPRVESGHVAAWVGVGGVGLGPGGDDEWLQVGFSGFPGGTSSIYYEVARPGAAPEYVEIAAGVPAGESRRIAVLEMSQRPNWWRVWVDGRAVSPPVFLPGSGDRWRPVATAETWDGGRPACNRFAYRFDELAVAAAPGGDWRPFTGGYRFQDPGYRVLTNSTTSFLATASA